MMLVMPVEFGESSPVLVSKLEENLTGLKIGIDIDGVFQRTGPLVMNFASHELKTAYNTADLVKYWMLPKIAQNHGMTEVEADEFAFKAWNRPEILMTATPIPGATTLSKILHELEIKQEIITSRPGFTSRPTKDWFAQVAPWIPSENINIRVTNEIDQEGFKTKRIRDLAVDVFVEDSSEQAEEIIRETDAT